MRHTLSVCAAKKIVAALTAIFVPAAASHAQRFQHNALRLEVIGRDFEMREFKTGRNRAAHQRVIA